MEFIQFLERTRDRNDNWTAKWSERFPLHVGYKENWVLDKTTDTAYCEFHYFDNSATNPKWNVMDWCRILHIDNINDLAKYDNEGLPINFSEYVIGDIQANYIAKNYLWKVMLKLEEPIVRTYGILGETLTFTSQTTKKVGDITYAHAPYNHLTALERWLKLTPSNCDVYEKENGKDKRSPQNISWYNRIKILDEDFLRKLEFADETYNELNLYNVLLDNYDSSTGRTPSFFFDMNIASDLPNNPERDEYLLKFLEQDGSDKPLIESDKFFENIASYQLSKSLSNFATGLITNATNISPNSPISFPSKYLYAVPEVNSNIRDTTKGELEWVLRLPHKIKNIVTLKKMVMEASYFEGGGHQGYKIINAHLNRVTLDEINREKVLEQKQYNSKIDPTSDEAVHYQWYVEGDNLIYLNNYKYEDDGPAVVYFVEYVPLVDARILIGEGNFIQQINQTSSQIDSKKFSNYMQNYLDGMNKADIVVTKTYNSFNEFKDYHGCQIIINNVEYLVTNISYQNRNCQYEVAFQLNQNHFRKNDSIQAPQCIRTNVSIATDGLKERKIYYNQTVKVSLKKCNNNEKNSILVDKCKLLSSLILGTYKKADEPQYSFITFNSIQKRFEDTNLGGVWKNEVFTKNLFAPITKFKFGNQLCFNIKLLDNAQIGKQKTITASARDYKFGSVKSQVPILYTDYFGEVQKIDIVIGRASETAIEDFSESVQVTTGVASEKLSDIKREVKVTETFYKLVASVEKEEGNDEISDMIKNTKSIEVKGLNVQKDMLECFNLTLALRVISDDVIITDNFLENSVLLRGECDGELMIAFYTKAIYEDNGETPIAIRKIISTKVISNNQENKILFSFEQINDVFRSLAFLRDDKILLIINNIDDIIQSKKDRGEQFNIFELYFN